LVSGLGGGGGEPAEEDGALLGSALALVLSEDGPPKWTADEYGEVDDCTMVLLAERARLRSASVVPEEEDEPTATDVGLLTGTVVGTNEG